MATREIDLVGSIPADSTESAISWALTQFADHLRCVPDGETGDRSSWILSQDSRFRSNPALELVREGDWSDYDHIPRYRVRDRLRSGNLDFQYAGYALTAAAVLKKQSVAAMMESVVLKVGIPSPLDLAVFNLGPFGAREHVGVFRAATAREITQIHDRLGDGVIFQIEIPFETIMAVRADRLPGSARRLLHRRLARSVHRLVSMCPSGAQFSVHLCFGDLGRQPVVHASTARPVAELAAELAEGWPFDRPLRSLHLPLCDGPTPPSRLESYYEALVDLGGAYPRVIAGLAHLGCEADLQIDTLGIVEALLGDRVGIASPCGLGRMTMAEADQLAVRYLALARIP